MTVLYVDLLISVREEHSVLDFCFRDQLVKMGLDYFHGGRQARRDNAEGSRQDERCFSLAR